MKGLGWWPVCLCGLSPWEHRTCSLDCPPSLEVRQWQSYAGNRRVTTKRIGNFFQPTPRWALPARAPKKAPPKRLLKSRFPSSASRASIETA